LLFLGLTSLYKLIVGVEVIVARDYTQKHHTRQDSSGRVIGTTERPLPDNTQHSQQTDIHTPGEFRTLNPSKREAADPRLGPRSHLDRQALLVAIAK